MLCIQITFLGGLRYVQSLGIEGVEVIGGCFVENVVEGVVRVDGVVGVVRHGTDCL